jgi:cell wall-associated NlpC family hydrolase
VLVFEIEGKWARVECPLQQEFTHNNYWQGYPGWVYRAHLSTDITDINKLTIPTADDNARRDAIVAHAQRHIDHPYLWGGRSLHIESIAFPATGVDCSGLLNWAYKEAGLQIPRDAHEQYMAATPIAPALMKPGDAIFLAKDTNPDRITHVMMIAGKEHVIEAPSTGEHVRTMSLKKRFSKKSPTYHKQAGSTAMLFILDRFSPPPTPQALTHDSRT